MPLSLDSIFRPFNEFFSQKFAADNGGPVKFRFAHLPRVFVDSDFLNPVHPEWGPSPAMAKELFSTVVDGVTRFDTDGRTVWLSPSSRISDLYHDEILGPAIPFVASDITDTTQRQARIDSFNAAKADAMGVWERNKVESLDGTNEFRPSTAIPQEWWDRTDPGAWTQQSFVVKGAATSPRQPPGPADPVLRVKADDTIMRAAILSYVPAAQAAGGPHPPPAASQIRPAAALSRPAMMMASPALVMRATAAPVVAIHTDVSPQISALPYVQRTQIQAVIATNSSTKPLVTSDVTISFSYCVVNITRDWFHEAFTDNTSWGIPGQAKGLLSANDGHGVPALPVGFVAIKGLSIQAPWTPEDVSNLEQSVQFGPFNFDSKVVNGAVGHDGIQIIGWMLQDLPDLPPNAMP